MTRERSGNDEGESGHDGETGMTPGERVMRRAKLE